MSNIEFKINIDNIIAIKSWTGEDDNDDSLYKLRNILQNCRATMDVNQIISTSIGCEV